MIIYKLYIALFVILKVDSWKNKVKCKDNDKLEEAYVLDRN